MRFTFPSFFHCQHFLSFLLLFLHFFFFLCFFFFCSCCKPLPFSPFCLRNPYAKDTKDSPELAVNRAINFNLFFRVVEVKVLQWLRWEGAEAAPAPSPLVAGSAKKLSPDCQNPRRKFSSFLTRKSLRIWQQK